MSSQVVEFRLLQLVLNPIGDERRTVAMLHWDGRDMRFAWNRTDLHLVAGYARDDVGMVLDSVRERVRGMLQRPQTRLEIGLRLADAYPVTEGLGGLLTWGPARTGHAPNAEAHFQELMRLLGLHLPEARQPRQRSHDWVKKRLAALGDTIRSDLGAAATGRLLVGEPVRGIVEAKPPISWLNGRWHHSFPVIFENATTDSIGQKFQAAFGRIDASAPANHVGVIVSVYPDQADFRAGLDRAEGFARDRLGDRVECLRAPLLRPGHIGTEELERRIRADLASARSA